MSKIERWADPAMFEAAPMQAGRDQHGNIVPRVVLLFMTPDPLGANAAMGRMYKGIPTYDAAEITDEERRQFWKDSLATHLKAPLEAIKLHFFIEGVTRSFTHQMVRQRTAVYAQESMRFAVVEDLPNRVSLPPSLVGRPADDPAVVVWNITLDGVAQAYEGLISAGIPAEDARGLMPHATTTRLHYVTDLRNLAEHAGNRLCTQAQFEWRAVFTGIRNAILDYSGPGWDQDYEWQYEEIAGSELFRPVCYVHGKCPFQASFDRDCTIRKRADAGQFDLINPEEWMFDPTAARRGGGHE